jgi:hypothetical protein
MFLPFFAQVVGGNDPNVYLGANRIAGLSSVGYSLTGTQRQLLNPLFRYLRGQGLSSNLLFHHDPRVGLNNNLFTATGTLSTQTVALATGIYTFWFASGAGTITSSNGTGTATNHGATTAGVPRQIVVTVAGTFTFTVSGVVTNAQLEIGSSATVYNLRTDTTVLKLNNTINNALGDGTFVNGTSANMTTLDATAGEVLNYNNTLSQGISTTLTAHQTDLTVIQWVKATNFTSNRITMFKSVPDWRLVLQTDAAVRLSTSSSIASPSGTLVAGTWACVAFTLNNAGNAVIYKNGVQVASGTIPRAIDNTNPVQIGETVNGPFLGQIGESTLINTVLTPTQILAIYNIQKARYGL